MILLIRAQKDDISRYQTLINMQVNGRQISSENIYDYKNPYLNAYRSEKEKNRTTTPVVLPERAENVYNYIF